MPPETPGPAAPRDPSPSEGAPGSAPSFKPSVERVDERTGGQPVATTAAPAGSSTSGPVEAEGLPYAADDAPRRRRPEPRDGADTGRHVTAERRPGKVRARKVRRIVRHIDPWSVLKISALFFTALFLIVSVASAVLWSAARGSGAIEDVESFVTSVGGFGNCEPVEGERGDTTPTTQPADTTTLPVDQLDPQGAVTTLPAGPVEPVDPGDDEDCPEGQVLEGEFKFEDGRIFQAFVLGGFVLVLAGAATAVVLAVLFNLISDLTGGLRLTVLEEEPPPKPRSGSPGPRPRD